MDRARFTSADFAKVPSSVKAELPERLLHADVLNSRGALDSALSRERSHLVRTVDLPSRTLSVTIGGLSPGQATRMHRHNYETIIYVLSGAGVSLVEKREVPWRAGDALYVPAWAWHQHINRGEEEVLYVACENAPLLQNLGVALREEA